MTCPCESGSDASACCQRSDGAWYKAPKNFQPDPPATGYSHPGCYLRDSHDCSPTLSDEHYVSATALKAIDAVLGVSGLPWLKSGESKAISAERLVSRVLCTRHNNALSSLDAQGGRFVRWIRIFSDSSTASHLTMVLLNGLDIERWCLKTFLGLLSSASLQVRPGHVVRQFEFTPRLMDLLRGRIPDEWGRGLWVRTEADWQVNTIRALSVSPVSKPGTNTLFGLTLNIVGFDFLYSTAPIVAEDSVFRPSQLRFRGKDRECIVELSWPPSVTHSGPVGWQWLGQRAP